ncbi:MAG: hypothetical protein V4577_25865, partial [Bacteroidota bacterium]
MKTNLLFSGTICRSRGFFMALLTTIMLFMSLTGKAQLYYVTTDGNGNVASANDALYKIKAGDASATLQGSGSIQKAPGLVAVDLAHGRAFVVELFNIGSHDNGINVISSSDGTTSHFYATSLSTDNHPITGIKYNPFDGLVYYLQSDGTTSSTSADGIFTLDPGTGTITQIASSVCPTPTAFAIDPVHKLAYVVENSGTATNKLHVFDISTSTASLISADERDYTNTLRILSLDYDVPTDKLYYLSSDQVGSAGSTPGTNDAFGYMNHDGSNMTAIKTGITRAPQLMAVDAANKKAYIYDGTAIVTPKQIEVIDFSSTATQSALPPTFGSNVLVQGMSIAQLPTMTTASAGSVTSSSATLGGNTVTDAAITESGVVYSSTNTTPTITDSKAVIGTTAPGTFSGTVSSLAGSTKYYVRAYATTSAGTAYGSVINFTTLTAATTITGLVIKSGNTTPTNASSVQYTATFAAPITGLTTGSFSVTGVTGASVTGVAAATGNDWTITVGTGTGSGTLALSMASGSAPTPTVSNTPFAATSNFTIDKTAPSVSSIVATTPSNASPTNATSVVYTVTFSENVTGVDASDFTLTTSGTSGTIGAISGSGATYTVPVNSITGTGTLSLNLKGSGTGIQDGVGNAIASGFTGVSVYNIDQTAPTAVSITATTPTNASPTNATNVVYTVIFSKSVTGVDGADFSLATSGTSGTIGTVTGSGTTYSVPVSAISGTGTLGLNLNASGTGIQDAVGNALSGGFTGDVYNIDNTAPVVSSVSAPVTGTYGVGGVLSFTVHFAEPVNITGTPSLNFTMNSGTAQANYTAGTGTADITFHYSVVTGDSDPDGIVINNLALNSGTIKDLVGNNADLTLNNVGSTSGVLVDAVPPVVTSITIAGASPTNATSVDFTVKFSKTVTGVQLSDFSTTTSGTTGTSSSVTGSGDTYTVTVGSVSGNGTLGLNLNNSGTAIFDDNSNQLVAGFTGGTYTIDNTAPTVSIGAPTPTVTGAGGSVTYNVTYSDANFNSSTLSSGDITLNITGTANAGTITIDGGSGLNRTVTLSGITGLGTIGINIAANTASDLAGNLAGAAGPSATFTVASSTATLQSLTLNPNAVLTRVAGPDYADYTANIHDNVSTVTIKAVTTDNNATLTVNGVAATSGVD